MSADVPKRYQYKTYDNTGIYLGNLPASSSEFNYSYEINTAGAQVTVTCDLSVDTAPLQGVSTIDDEAGNPIMDENGFALTSEGAPNIVAPATSSGLIKNGNRVVIIEQSYYNPNGKVVFSGLIENWKATFGGGSDGDTIELIIYSDSADLDNYLLTGPPFAYTIDQTQAVQNASDSVYTVGGSGNAWFRNGQSFTVGTGVTNVASITLLMNGAGNVTVNLYSNVNFSSGFIGSTLVAVDTGGATAEVQFSFANPLKVIAGTVYYFNVVPNSGNTIAVYYQSTSVYAGGSYYSSTYTGTGSPTYAATSTKDLYFKTSSSNGSTSATFTAADPTTGMLKPIIDDYVRRGGRINYNSTSIDATGLSLTYPFNTQTVYEGLNKILELSPNGFYYYIDLGTNTLYFKQTSSTADVILQRGVHISTLELSATIENVENQVYVIGGQPTGTTNLFKLYSDSASITRFGPRLVRKTDGRVTDSDTADAVGGTELAGKKDENYQTTVTVTDKQIDISALHVGQVVGFRAFGSFIDQLLLQIVRIDKDPDQAKLTLGLLPKRLNPQFEYLLRNLLVLQTVDNPSAPS